MIQNENQYGDIENGNPYYVVKNAGHGGAG